MNKESYTFGATKCGLILEEKLKTNKNLHRKIASFFEVTMRDFKILINGFETANQANRVRQTYLLGRFQQLDEFAKTNSLGLDTIKRLKYIIKFQTRI
jgi:hypothetical protein